MTLVRRIHDVRDPAKIRPWLRTVAINAARAAARKRKVRLRLTAPNVDVEHESAPTDQGESDALRDEANRALDAAQRLHPDYREPLLLRCVRGMSYRRIAQTLDLPVTTIETRWPAARARALHSVGCRRVQAPRHGDHTSLVPWSEEPAPRSRPATRERHG